MAVFLQSLVEFPLRMPANALYVSAIMGLGWEVVFSVRRLSRSASIASVASFAQGLDTARPGRSTQRLSTGELVEPETPHATTQRRNDASDAIDAMTRSTQRPPGFSLLTRLVIFT